MRRNDCSELAPRLCAACSCSVPISSRTGTTSRMTSGSDTKTVAITMPGVAKMTSKPASSSAGPNQPLRPPYANVSASPTTIGETDNGMSSMRAQEALARELVAHEQQ